MARARTVRLEEIDGSEPTKAEQEREDLQEADDTEGGDLFAALDEMRGTAGVMFIVVRTFPSTPDVAGYVGSLTPAEFSLERMAELYGPGKYRVRVKGPKGWLPGGGTVAIAKGIDPPATGASGSGDFATFLRTVQERDAAAATRRDRWIELAIPGAITLLAAVLGKNNGPDLSTLITALKPAPGPSITDLVTSLSSLKSLTETAKPEGTQLESFLNILEKVKDLSGEGKGESTWIDLARDMMKEGLPMVQPLLENFRVNQQQAAQRPPLLMPPGMTATLAPMPLTTPVSTASPTLDESASSTDSGGNDMLAFFMPMIRAQLAKLITWAALNKRVDLYAEVFLDELPSIVHSHVKPEQALEALQREDWWEQIVMLEPRLHELVATRKWFDDLRIELIDIITEQLKEDSKDPPAQIIDSLNGEEIGS